jgi:hypothetical protein
VCCVGNDTHSRKIVPNPDCRIYGWFHKAKQTKGQADLEKTVEMAVAPLSNHGEMPSTD